MVLYVKPSSNQAAISDAREFALNEPRKRTFMGKIFSGMFSKLKAPFENTDQTTEKETNENFSIWNLAQLGVKGVNAMGDHDYTLVRDYNKKGNVKGLIVLEE